MVYRFAYIDHRGDRVISPDFATLTGIAAIGGELLVGSGVEVDEDFVGPLDGVIPEKRLRKS